MIELGCFDPNVSDASCAAYTREVEQLTRVPLAQVKPGLDKLVVRRLAAAPGVMSVLQVQQGLQACGFFPGGKLDGIFGYRSQSALRLFQEYVRSMEGQVCTPDGRMGPQTQAHLQRWLDQGLRPDWAPVAGEYEAWLGLLEAAKQKYLAEPGPVLSRVNAYSGASDTRKVAQWDFTGPGQIHLIGIRRREMTGRFDDIFVLLIKGLCFKFQGSTEPGASSDPKGPPYLVPGQHDYHFGWHRSTYLALRPRSNGVLIIRAGADKQLDEADLARGLEPNATINIHWGGRGMDGVINSWSEGCQVINGSVYINAAGRLVSCAGFAAISSTDPTSNPAKTRGAYNLLLDLITALGSDLPGGASLRYTLLQEEDLALAPALAQGLAAARQQVAGLVKA